MSENKSDKSDNSTKPVDNPKNDDSPSLSTLIVTFMIIAFLISITVLGYFAFGRTSS